MSERKEWKNIFSENESLNNVLFRDSFVPQAVLSPTTYTFLDVNIAAVTLFGCERRDEFIGKTPADFSPQTQEKDKASGTAAIEHIKKAVENDSHMFEWVHMRPNGDLWTADIHLMLFTHEDQAIIHFTAKDISKRTLVEKALETSEEKFSLTFNSSLSASAILSNGSLRFIDVNESFLSLFGYQKAELIGHTLDELQIVVNHEKTEQINRQLMKEKQIQHAEHLYRTRNGDIINTLFSATIIEIADEECILVELIDHTHSKKVEKALRDARGFLETVINNIPHQVFWKNDDLEYLGCNKRFSEVVGLDAPDDVIKKPDYDFARDKTHAESYRECDRQIIDSKKPVIDLEEMYHDDEGNEGTVLTSKVPVYDDEGNCVCLVGICSDITKRKKVENKLRRSEKSLERAQNIAKLGSWEWNTTSDVLIWTAEVYRIYGLVPGEAEAIFETFLNIVHPDDRDMLKKSVTFSVENRLPISVEHRVVHHDGTNRYVFQLGEIFVDELNEDLLYVGTVQDVTDRKMAEFTIKRSEKQYRELVEYSNSIILKWNPQGLITYINPFGLAFFGYSEDELINKNVVGTIVPKSEGETQRNLEQMMRDISKNPEKYAKNDNENICKDGSRKWVSWSNTTIYDEQGKFIEMSSIGNDITKLKQMEEQLKGLSLTDSLTGLANRREFDATLQQELNRAHRALVPLTLIMLDIDFFKAYNDTYGHQAGDEALKLVAKALSQSTNRSGELTARYGGEEFAIILPATDKTRGVRFAEFIRENVSAIKITHESSKVAQHVTVSVGVVSMIPGLETTSADIIELADTALYKAKHSGRNCVESA